MYKRINGLQHIGVAVSEMDKSLKFYRKFFGLNIPFFDSVQPAPLMDVYTRNSTITKRASMVVNLQGGCAIEVICPTSFKPVRAKFDVLVGDLGICITQLKCKNIEVSHAFCKENGAPALTDISIDPTGRKTFYLEDLDRNVWQYVEGDQWYTDANHHSGGVIGCSTGVSDMDKALGLYRDILGFDQVVYDSTGVFEDWKNLSGGKNKYRRVMLTQSAQPGGGFAKVTGKNYIELIQALDRTPNYIFKDRIWGDTGFAHIGFDVKGMAALGKDLAAAGYGFTCDSNNAIGMGQTKVHCTYIQDNDVTLIEMIEVYKVPIMEKWGIFLNVEKRDPLKPLPDFMLKALRFSRIKD
jgi:catechol 2,3-dioxygenase-like lactoylglutathione lyase family enzyme